MGYGSHVEFLDENYQQAQNAFDAQLQTEPSSSRGSFSNSKDPK